MQKDILWLSFRRKQVTLFCSKAAAYARALVEFRQRLGKEGRIARPWISAAASLLGFLKIIEKNLNLPRPFIRPKTSRSLQS